MGRNRIGVRTAAALGAGKASRWLLHNVLHRGAMQVPGLVGLKIDPQLVAHLRGKARQGSIVICGTNGKTTTTGVIADALEHAGKKVLCNRRGANMLPGTAAAFIASPASDWAVIEADELSTVKILPQLQPTYFVLLNLFRDQLDRAGEIDRVQDTIVEALASSPGTTLVVCADDPLCWAVALRAREAGTKVVAFGMGEDLGLPAERVPEGRFCQLCGGVLGYEHRSYAQLGSFSCPDCDFARPELDVAAKDVKVSREGVSFDLEKATGDGYTRAGELKAGFGGIYMAYNLLAAVSVLSLAGVDLATIQKALDNYNPQNGRLQHFTVNGREVALNLAKNPTGFNQNLSMLLADERPKAVYVVINDKVNDGRDVSWLWDVDFERLAGQGEELLVMAGGHRANDMQVRLKYAGITAAIAYSVEAALAEADTLDSGCPLYVLTNYSALEPARKALEKMEKEHE